MPTWYAVARNEYRLMTSSLRRIRKAVPVLLVLLPSLLFLVVLYYANQVHLQSYLEAALREYLRAVYGYVTEFEFAFGEVDITLLMCQFMGIMGFMLPVVAAVGSVFRETEVISNDMILASPLKPRDLLLGRFVANLFFLPVILGFFSFLLFPAIINHGLSSVASVLIIVSVASLPTLVGIWVGVLLSAYIQTKSEFSPRIKDIGKAILGVFGIIFGLSYFLLFSSQTSSLYWTYLPTTWVTNIIYFAIAGTNLAKVAYNFGIFSFYYYVPLQPDPLVSLVLLLGFVALVFYIGAKLSSRIYRFEVPVSKVTTIEKEDWFFRTIKSTIPPPLGALTAVQLKEFSRSLDTVARVSTVLIFPLVIYFLNAMGISNSYMPSSGVFGVFFLPGFAFFYILMAAAMIGLIEASQMTVKQKDLFWTYKKAPHGVKRLVYSKFLEMLIVGLPISVVTAVLFQLGLGFESSGLLTLVLVLLFMTTISSAIALGVYCARPVFKEQSRGHLINFLIFAAVAFIIEGLMLLFAVFPWILSIIPYVSALGTLLSLPPQSSTWVVQTPLFLTTMAQLSVNPAVSFIGTAASAALGVVAAYLSIRIGISKLEKFE